MAFKRTIGLRTKKDDATGELRILASSDARVNMGGWTEILEHDGAEIDTSSATALLLNHDPDQILGPASGYDVRGGEMWCSARIIDGARLSTGIGAQEAVDSGALRGVSISYDYDVESDDVTIDKASRTISVHRWRLLETSLTPIPADKTCSVRAFPLDDAGDGEGLSRMNEEENKPEDGERVDGENTHDEQANDEGRAADEGEARAEGEGQPDGVDSDEAKGDDARNAALLRVRSVADATGVKVTNETFDGLDDEPAMLRKVVELQKEEAMSRHKTPNANVAPTQVTVDAADKFLRSAGAGMSRSIGLEVTAKDEEFGSLYLPTIELVRRCAAFDGERDVDMMGPMELASYAIRRMSYSGQRDGANKTSASFAVLTGNVANKALLSGFNRYNPVWNMFCTVKDASDFKIHPHVAAAIGSMTETPEGEAFPESNQREGSYNSQLAMWGHTLSITEQALVNDDLGEIMRSFAQQGYSAARTIDRQAFRALLNADYTNDLTTGAALGTAGNLDKVRSDLKKKLSPAGEKMELDPAILLVDPTNRLAADSATGQLYGVSSGANAQTGSNAVRSLNVIDSTFVSDTTLKAGVAATDYYLLSDPMLSDTVTVEFLRGQREPRIVPFDPGAVAAAKFKVQLPFQATIATHNDNANATRVTGVQKATA